MKDTLLEMCGWLFFASFIGILSWSIYEIVLGTWFLEADAATKFAIVCAMTLVGSLVFGLVVENSLE